MLKKVLRYVGAALGITTFLALILDVWSTPLSETALKLFDKDLDLIGVSLGDKYTPAWLTLTQIFVVLTLAISVIMLLFFVLNDAKVLKFGKLEKWIALVLLVVAILGSLSIIIAISVNKVTTLGATYGLKALVGAWLYIAFGISGGVVALIGSCLKK